MILDHHDYQRWLEPGDPQRPPVDLLRSYPAELMKAWKVSKDVGNVKNDHPGLYVESLVGEDEGHNALPKRHQPEIQGHFSSAADHASVSGSPRALDP